MRTKFQVKYNIDKLSLVYEIPPTFWTAIANAGQLTEYILGSAPHTVFIFTRKFSRVQRVVQAYTLSVMNGAEQVVIGEFRNDIEDAITLDIDNRFLYSGRLHLLYQFEQDYGLTFTSIKYIDVCCDSNQNLPRKLNSVMHSPNCDVSRRAGKKEITRKGNQRLGVKLTDNIKTLKKTERPPVSYYFYLTPSGCRRPISLKAYDKAYEIEQESHKTYISEALQFDGGIYRLEVSSYWCELSIQSHRKNGWSHHHIYWHLSDKSFLKEFFIRYINRFYNLKINGKKMKLSEFLRLDFT